MAITVATSGGVINDAAYTPSTSTVVSCVSDGSDATYAYATASTAQKMMHYYFMLPAYSGIAWRYRLAVKVSGHTTTYPGRASTLYIVGSKVDGSWSTPTATTVTPPSNSTTATWRYGAWTVIPPNMSLTGMMNGFFRFNAGATQTGDIRVYQFQLELESTTAPTAPTVNNLGTVTASEAAVVWTHNDGDGWDQTFYEVKVFDSATYSGGGFSPATSNAVWEEDGFGSANSTIVRELDTGVTYRVYVRTAKTVRGRAQWSPWGNNAAFTPTIPIPGLRVTPVWDVGTQSMQVQARGQINLLPKEASNMESSPTLYWTATTNCSLAQSATQVKYDTYSLRMSSTAGGDMATTLTNVESVTAGVESVAQAYVRAGSAARTCRVDIIYYNSGMGVTGTITGTGVVNSTSNFNALPFASGVAPAGSVWAAMRITVLATGGAAELHYVDGALLAPNGNGSAVPFNPGSITGSQLIFERLEPSGKWRTVRRGGPDDWLTQNLHFTTGPTNDQLVTVVDYESRRGVSVTYRVTLKVAQYTGDLTVRKVTGSATATSDNQWWLKVVDDPSMNAVVQVQTPLKVEIQSDVGVFRPLDASGAIAVTGAVYGEDGEYTFVCETNADYVNKIRPLMMHPGTLLVQDALTRHKWIRWTSPRTVEETSSGGRPVRTVTLGYIEVEPDL